MDSYSSPSRFLGKEQTRRPAQLPPLTETNFLAPLSLDEIPISSPTGSIGGGPSSAHSSPSSPGLLMGPGPPIITGENERGPPGCNLFVFHLPNELTNWDLYLLFRKFGTILSVHTMVNKNTGLSRGFGFVSFAKEHEAIAAVKAMDGFRLGKKRLKVQRKREHGEIEDGDYMFDVYQNMGGGISGRPGVAFGAPEEYGLQSGRPMEQQSPFHGQQPHYPSTMASGPLSAGYRQEGGTKPARFQSSEEYLHHIPSGEGLEVMSASTTPESQYTQRTFATGVSTPGSYGSLQSTPSHASMQSSHLQAWSNGAPVSGVEDHDFRQRGGRFPDRDGGPVYGSGLLGTSPSSDRPKNALSKTEYPGGGTAPFCSSAEAHPFPALTANPDRAMYDGASTVATTFPEDSASLSAFESEFARFDISLKSNSSDENLQPRFSVGSRANLGVQTGFHSGHNTGNFSSGGPQQRESKMGSFSEDRRSSGIPTSAESAPGLPSSLANLQPPLALTSQFARDVECSNLEYRTTQQSSRTFTLDDYSIPVYPLSPPPDDQFRFLEETPPVDESSQQHGKSENARLPQQLRKASNGFAHAVNSMDRSVSPRTYSDLEPNNVNRGGYAEPKQRH